MLIHCPSCASSYHIARVSVGWRSRRVHCALCETDWIVGPLFGEEAENYAADAGSNFEPAGLPVPIDDEFDWGMGSAAAPPQHEEAEIWAPVRPRSAQRDWRDQGRFDPAAGTRRLRGLARLGAAAASVALLMALVGGRDFVVRHVPATAAAYARLGLPVNLRGLALQGVHSTLVSEGGSTVLAVEGEIVNDRKSELVVPDMRLAVESAQGQELYTWTAQAPKAKLEAGGTMAFRARLTTPPAQGQSVVVRFADAQKSSG